MWRKQDPEFDMQVHQSIAAGRAKMVGRLVEQADHGNVQAITYWLSRRCPEFREPRDQPVVLSLGGASTAAELVEAILESFEAAVESGSSPAAIKGIAEAAQQVVALQERADTRARFEEIQQAARAAGLL